MKCRDCGMIFSIKHLSQNERPNYDNKYAKNWYTREDIIKWHFSDEWIESNLRRLTSIKKYVKRGKLLDIGCATGSFLKVASENGFICKGIELSDSSAKIGRERFGIDILSGNFLSIHIPNHCFDIVTMFHTLDHLDDPFQALHKVKAILKPGGILAVSVVNFNSLPRLVLGKKWQAIDPDYHLYYFTTKTMKKITENASLKLQELYTTGIDPYRTLLDFVRISRKLNKTVSFKEYQAKSSEFYGPILKRPKLMLFSKYLVNLFTKATGMGTELRMIAKKAK